MRMVRVWAIIVCLSAALCFSTVRPSRVALADLPGGAGCPATHVFTGNWLYKITATAPAGGPWDGVCINLTGTGGNNNAAVLLTNAPGCPAPTTVAAESSYVWSDWGTNKCVDASEQVVIKIKSIQGLPLGVQNNAATWHGSTGTGNVTVEDLGAAVGGVAEQPDVQTLPVATSHGNDNTSRLLLAIAASVVALTVAASYLIQRRRHS